MYLLLLSHSHSKILHAKFGRLILLDFAPKVCMHLCISLRLFMPLLAHLWFIVYCFFTVAGLLLQDGFAQLKANFVSRSRGNPHPLHSELEGSFMRWQKVLDPNKREA